MLLKPRQRQYPRISVNKLGEYAATNDAARRRRIIFDQKYPKDYIGPFYTEAQEFLTDFLLAGDKNEQVIWQKVDEFLATDANTPWQETRYRANADALVAFLGIMAKIDLDKFEIGRGLQDPPKLMVREVEVSVKPDLMLVRRSRSGNLTEGALKLYINKNHPMTKESGEYTATTLHEFVDTYPVMDGLCDHRFCYVVDVFGQRIFSAPRSYKKRRKSIDAACEEVKRAWPEL